MTPGAAANGSGEDQDTYDQDDRQAQDGERVRGAVGERALHAEAHAALVARPIVIRQRLLERRDREDECADQDQGDGLPAAW